jgi:hypothetical protein
MPQLRASPQRRFECQVPAADLGIAVEAVENNVLAAAQPATII